MTAATQANPDDWEMIEVSTSASSSSEGTSFTQTSPILEPLSGDFKVVCCKYEVEKTFKSLLTLFKRVLKYD